MLMWENIHKLFWTDNRLHKILLNNWVFPKHFFFEVLDLDLDLLSHQEAETIRR